MKLNQLLEQGVILRYIQDYKSHYDSETNGETIDKIMVSLRYKKDHLYDLIVDTEFRYVLVKKTDKYDNTLYYDEFKEICKGNTFRNTVNQYCRKYLRAYN